MTKSSFSRVDEYGFERSSSFNVQIFDDFMSNYLKTLTRRSKKWNDLMKKNAQKLKNNNQLKRYIRKGIPGEHRKQIWMFASKGNYYQEENSELYAILKQKTPPQTIIDTIKTDIPRTFPENIFFNSCIELPEQLFNILVAFALDDPEVGYCQGLNYIVGLLLLATKNEEASFWLLKMLVGNILPKYYIITMAGLITDIEVLSILVKLRDPDVHTHIEALGVPWAVLTTKWFVCLFAEVLPTETVLRIWDCLFNEGSKILFRVALTLIIVHRLEILKTTDLPTLIDCFKAMVKGNYVLKCHTFIQDIFNVPGKLPNKLITKLREENAAKLENGKGNR